MNKFFLSVLVCILFSSCAFMFNSVVFPNQCQRCQVIDSYSGTILYEEEGCGGENVNMEDKAKVKAYELSRGGNMCDLDVVCETWKQDIEE